MLQWIGAKNREVTGNKKTAMKAVFVFGGSGEIRTHGGLLTHGSFQDCCHKPLGHTSIFFWQGRLKLDCQLSKARILTDLNAL